MRLPPQSKRAVANWWRRVTTRRLRRRKIHFRFFMHDESGARHALTRTGDGKYTTKQGGQEYTAEEIAELAVGPAGTLQSERHFACRGSGLSVADDCVLRRRGRDRLLCANCRGLPSARTDPTTPILPRSSLTMIERHTGRVLERYGSDASRICLLVLKAF